jgi:type IV secretion system protein VirB11
MSVEGGVYLRTYLTAFAPWLDQADVTDILVNQPGEVWVESARAGMQRFDAPDINAVMLQRLAQQIAALSSQGVSRAHPLLAATLPGGARVQIAAPPATRQHLALAIRKHMVADLTLENYAEAGAFAQVRRATLGARAETDTHLVQRLDQGDVTGFFRNAVRAGKTIVISGGTGTGKTTFLNALLKEIPESERVIAIEDAAEVRLSRPNAVGLIAVKGDQGEARVGVDELLQASLRMRPDRLLVGEIRGAEAFTFLRAINTGHPGSITTIHADSPMGALDQIAFMTLQSGLSLQRAEIIAYAKSVIDVIVQLSRHDGKRLVASVWFNRDDA